MTTVDLAETQLLVELVGSAQAEKEILIIEGGKPVARLTAIPDTSEPPARVAGLHRGAVWMSEDFDQLLSDEFWMGTGGKQGFIGAD